MKIETPDELAEFLANALGVYGAHDQRCALKVYKCRCCFVTAMTARIRESVANEKLIQRLREGERT